MGMDQILISAGQVNQQVTIGFSSAMVKANIGSTKEKLPITDSTPAESGNPLSSRANPWYQGNLPQLNAGNGELLFDLIWL